MLWSIIPRNNALQVTWQAMHMAPRRSITVNTKSRKYRTESQAEHKVISIWTTTWTTITPGASKGHGNRRLAWWHFSLQVLRPVSTSANLVARTGTAACSSIEKKQSDWFSLILVAKKLNLIQLPELTARSPVNARFQLGFRSKHALIAHRLVARPNSAKWKPALTTLYENLLFLISI